MTEAFHHDVAPTPEQTAQYVDFALRHIAHHASKEMLTARAGQQVVLHTLESGEQLHSKYFGNKEVRVDNQTLPPRTFGLWITSPMYHDAVFAKLFQEVHLPYEGLQLLALEQETSEDLQAWPAEPFDLDWMAYNLHNAYITEQVGGFCRNTHPEDHHFPGIELIENR